MNEKTTSVPPKKNTPPSKVRPEGSEIGNSYSEASRMGVDWLAAVAGNGVKLTHVAGEHAEIVTYSVTSPYVVLKELNQGSSAIIADSIKPQDQIDKKTLTDLETAIVDVAVESAILSQRNKVQRGQIPFENGTYSAYKEIIDVKLLGEYNQSLENIGAFTQSLLGKPELIEVARAVLVKRNISPVAEIKKLKAAQVVESTMDQFKKATETIDRRITALKNV